MNKIIMIGHLGGDPEVVETKNSCVTKFSLAVRSGYGDNERTDWFACEAWGDKRADVMEEYLHKGSKILVEGRMLINEWEDKKTEEKRSKPVINIDNFEFLDSKKDDDDDDRSSRRSSKDRSSSRSGRSSSRDKKSSRKEEKRSSSREYEDDDVPF